MDINELNEKQACVLRSLTKLCQAVLDDPELGDWYTKCTARFLCAAPFLSHITQQYNKTITPSINANQCRYILKQLQTKGFVVSRSCPASCTRWSVSNFVEDTN